MANINDISKIIKTLSQTEKLLGFKTFSYIDNINNSAIRYVQSHQNNLDAISRKAFEFSKQNDILNIIKSLESKVINLNYQSLDTLESISNKVLAAQGLNQVAFSEHFGLINHSINSLSEKITRLNRFSSIEKSLDIFNRMPDLSGLFAKHSELLAKFSQADYSINNDGSILFDKITLGPNEINEAIDGIFEEFFEPTFFTKFESKLEKLKEPLKAIALWVLDKIVIAFLVSVMAGVYTQTITKDIQPKLNQNDYVKKSELKSELKNITKKYSLEDLKGLRVVTGNGVRIRTKPRRDSEIIGLLYMGKVVRVIYKKRHWVCVESIDEKNGETLTGWLSIKYTTNLKR